MQSWVMNVKACSQRARETKNKKNKKHHSWKEELDHSSYVLASLLISDTLWNRRKHFESGEKFGHLSALRQNGPMISQFIMILFTTKDDFKGGLHGGAYNYASRLYGYLMMCIYGARNRGQKRGLSLQRDGGDSQVEFTGEINQWQVQNALSIHGSK